MNDLTTPSLRFTSPAQLKYTPANAFGAGKPAMASKYNATTAKDSVHFGSAGARHRYELFNADSEYFQGIRINNTPYYIYLSQPEVSERYPNGSEKTLEYDLYASASTEPDPVGQIQFNYEQGQGWSSYKRATSSSWIPLIAQ